MWRGKDSNLRRQSQQIYSLPRLATLEPLRANYKRQETKGHSFPSFLAFLLRATSRNRTRDPLITSEVLYQLSYGGPWQAKRCYIFVTYNCVFKRHSFIIYKIPAFCQEVFQLFRKIIFISGTLAKILYPPTGAHARAYPSDPGCPVYKNFKTLQGINRRLVKRGH